MNMVKDFDYPAVRKLIRESSLETSIYVGCDSQVKGKTTDFVTVIIVHYDSRHGAKMFHRIDKVNRRVQLRERLWQEVTLAGQIGMEIVDEVGARHLAIHLDLNTDPLEKSSVVTKQAIAYIRGLQLEPVVKPDAFAATHCADHIIRR